MSDPAENRDVRGNTIKPHSVEAESVNTGGLYRDDQPDIDHLSFELFIDPDNGDDGNSGYTESDSLASLKEALLRLPTVAPQPREISHEGKEYPPGDNFRAVLKMANGTTLTTKDVEVYAVPYPLKLTSVDPQATNPTIEAAADTEYILIRLSRSEMEIDNIDIHDHDGVTESTLLGQQQSHLRVSEGVTIESAATDAVFQSSKSSTGEMFGTIDGLGEANRGVHTWYGQMNVWGTIKNCDVGGESWRNSLLAFWGTIDNCDIGLRASYESVIRENGTAFTNTPVNGIVQRNSTANLYSDSLDNWEVEDVSYVLDSGGEYKTGYRYQNIDVSNSVDSPTVYVEKSVDENGALANAMEYSAATEIDGDNTATKLVAGAGADFDNTGVRAAEVLVVGRNDADVFVDKLLWVAGGDVSVIESLTRSGPGARTYTEGGFQINIAIDDTGRTYNVFYRADSITPGAE